jgi:hypothetical protein
VTFDEALRELGIDASATPEEARRAYLRGIKVRKPETDPEGFRRLREAYEIVTGALAQPRMEPGPSPEVDEEEEETPPELAALAARLKDLPAETHLEERLAALREAVRDHPRSQGVRWWLVQELGRAGRRDEALEALRQGEADGLPGFLEARAVHFPGSIGPEDLSRLETSGSPEVLAIAARVHMAGSRHEEAAAALGRALDRLAEWENPALHPVPVWLPRGILALEAAGKAADARALHDRLWSWLSGTGDAALLKLWGADFSWRFVHELGQLDPAFPPELRRAAATAALERKAEPAIEEAKLLQKSDSKRAEQVSAMLYDLPILYDLYFRVLQGVGPGQQPRVVKEDPLFFKILFRVLLPIYLLGGIVSYCPNRQPLPTGTELHGTMHDQAQEAWNGLEAYSCGPGDLKLPQKACDSARLAVQKTQADDCAGAHAALDDMTTHLQGLTVPDLVGPRVFQAQMLSALSAGCGAYELKPGGTSPP